jgi:hypothetical protein
MSYYQIRYKGGYAIPFEINESLYRVFEKNGKYYFTATSAYCDNESDESDDICGEITRVYKTKAEAWFIILKELDAHIKQIQAKRDEMFHDAVKDGYSCITSIS